MIEQELIYKIKGVVFDVYNNIIGSWSEEDYENILFDALSDSGLTIERQKEFRVYYKGNKVGLYRTDLIAENKIILELKAVSEIFPLHEAQTISYLKVTGLKAALLINFGGSEIFIKVYPNKFKLRNEDCVFLFKQDFCSLNKDNEKDNEEYAIDNSFKRQLAINFDINKLSLLAEDKKIINPYLAIGKEILEILGPGYFHQVYRRAFWDELKINNIGFEWINQLELSYKGRIYNKKEVKFFKINNLLISIVAVQGLNDLIVSKFIKFIKHYKCNKGLIVNFNNTMVDFRLINRAAKI